MQTGQNSIAPENSLPQLGQMRCGSVFMDLTVLQRRLKLRNEHDSLVSLQRRGLEISCLAPEPLAKASSTEQCETRRRPLLDCLFVGQRFSLSPLRVLGWFAADGLLLGFHTSPVTSMSPG